MQAPEPQPDPDGGDALGPEPGGSPQEELDFSILFNYDYLNPLEGRWRLPPGLAPGGGLAWGEGQGPSAPDVTLLGARCGVPLPQEGRGRAPGQGLLPP